MRRPIVHGLLALAALNAGSPMPWEACGRMSDGDLRFIHAYLRHLPPVRNVTTPTRRPTP